MDKRNHMTYSSKWYSGVSRFLRVFFCFVLFLFYFLHTLTSKFISYENLRTVYELLNIIIIILDMAKKKKF